ncbi:MAG: response regulator transcription factor, partial [Acidobacteria bacterium]|nr:response regulator transcription factor [Acidobacteriota bacterium]
MTAILLVEDDAEMVSLLGRFLPEEGYEVRVVGDMASTLRAVSEFEPDLILLDIVLGSEDGRDILREIREVSDVPAIFLTGRGLESDRIAGLKLGADDYIVKPFSLGELAARIESVLRRAGANNPQHSIDAPNMKFGSLEINEQTHEVRLDGTLLELTAKEFSLLAFLAA